MTWQPYDPCPCGCGVVAWKLRKNGHGVGCKCRPCLGSRSKRKGQAAQSRVLKDAARAEGITMDFAPTHEEQARLLLHYEVKSGEQIPKGLRGDKMRQWENQARNFAHGQVPRRKWSLVFSMPGGERRIWMDFDEFVRLVSEMS